MTSWWVVDLAPSMVQMHSLRDERESKHIIHNPYSCLCAVRSKSAFHSLQQDLKNLRILWRRRQPACVVTCLSADRNTLCVCIDDVCFRSPPFFSEKLIHSTPSKKKEVVGVCASVLVPLCVCYIRLSIRGFFFQVHSCMLYIFVRNHTDSVISQATPIWSMHT